MVVRAHKRRCIMLLGQLGIDENKWRVGKTLVFLKDYEASPPALAAAGQPSALFLDLELRGPFSGGTLTCWLRMIRHLSPPLTALTMTHSLPWSL